jgi:hypothetical protein
MTSQAENDVISSSGILDMPLVSHTCFGRNCNCLAFFELGLENRKGKERYGQFTVNVTVWRPRRIDFLHYSIVIIWRNLNRFRSYI